MIDRKRLFDGARPIFSGKLNQRQIEGMEAMLAVWDVAGHTDLRWLAYELATALRETGSTMQPIAEWGRGKGRAYGRPDRATGQTYYGRGYVQLTWKANYQRAGQELGLDLVGSPDRAMQPDIAARIAHFGMVEGWFTGKKLADYFDADTSDWLNARRIINGLDHAGEIAGHAKIFHAALAVTD